MKQLRVTNPTTIARDEVARAIAAGHRVIIQFSAPGHREVVLRELNDCCASFGRSLEVRFYGHHFDGSCLRHLAGAVCLSLDCLDTAENLDGLRHLTCLEEFHLGIRDLEDREILAEKALHGVESLTLGPTRKSGLNLVHLKDFPHLTHFATVGHTRGIANLCGLARLASLALHQIPSDVDLSFVSALPALTNLRIMLGGRASIAEVAGAALKALAVIRVKGLADVGDLRRFPALEELLIEDQMRLASLDLRSCSELKHLRVLNCKTLTGIAGIATLARLEHLRISRTAVDYPAFISGGIPPTVRLLAFYTGKSKVDAQILEDLTARGFREFADSVPVDGAT